jgi:hypothetical protein
LKNKIKTKIALEKTNKQKIKSKIAFFSVVHHQIDVWF